MGARTTLVLVALVGGLAAVLYFTSQTPAVTVSAAISALDDRSLAQSTRFRWQFTDRPAFEVVRDDQGLFRLIEPIVDRASRGYLEQIVRAWESAELVATEIEDDEQGRMETGLDPPRFVFLAEWPDGHSIRYDVGDSGPLGTDRFLRREGKIWRGGNGLYESMRVGIDDLRDRQVFLLQESFCTALQVEQLADTGKREVLALQRQGGEWRMSSPFDGRVDQVAAVRFVTAVLSLRVDTFLSGLMRPPEGEPVIVVKATGGLGDEELRLWTQSGSAYGKLPGRTSWFQCDPQTYEAVFENAVNVLRAKTLISMSSVAEEVAEIVVDPGKGRGDRIHLLRDSVGKEWRLTEPIAARTHPSRVNELIQAINNMRAVEFLDEADVADPELGLGVERITVSLRGFDEREATSIWLGKPVDRGEMQLAAACRSDEQGTIVLTPRPVLEQFQRPWPIYCQLEVTNIPVQVGRIELERPAQGHKRVFGADAGRWRQVGVEGARDDVGEFVNDSLRDLRGKRAVDLRRGAYGEPDWTLTFAHGNGDRLQLLRVWDRGAELPLVVQPAAEGDVGFELGAHVSKLLRELWQ